MRSLIDASLKLFSKCEEEFISIDHELLSSRFALLYVTGNTLLCLKSYSFIHESIIHYYDTPSSVRLFSRNKWLQSKDLWKHNLTHEWWRSYLLIVSYLLAGGISLNCLSSKIPLETYRLSMSGEPPQCSKRPFVANKLLPKRLVWSWRIF